MSLQWRRIFLTFKFLSTRLYSKSKATMDKIENVTIKPLGKSMYMKPYTMYYKQNGKDRFWDLLTVHDSVLIIIYNITRSALIFVKQFRPATYYGSIPEEDRKINSNIDLKKYPPELGITIECCAGIVDKNITLAEIAKEEVLEECGYDVPVGALEKINSCRSGVGTASSLMTTFYCEVTDDMKVSNGGGIDDEMIDVVEMTVNDVKKYISQDDIKSPPSFMFGVHWFLYHKVK